MFCTNCGKQISDDSAFCTSCGQPVKTMNQAREAEHIQPANQTIPQMKPVSRPQTVSVQEKGFDGNRNKSMLIPVIIAVVVILILAVGIIFFMKNKDDSVDLQTSQAEITDSDNTDLEGDGDTGVTEITDSTDSEENVETTDASDESSDSTDTSDSVARKPGQVVVGDDNATVVNNNSVTDSENSESIDEDEDASEDGSNEYILPGSDTKKITKSDLKGMTAEECRLARNELYARHGRKFSDEELQKYFDSKSWYKGTIDPDDFTEDMLSEIELENRDTIVEYEEEQGYR